MKVNIIELESEVKLVTRVQWVSKLPELLIDRKPRFKLELDSKLILDSKKTEISFLPKLSVNPKPKVSLMISDSEILAPIKSVARLFGVKMERSGNRGVRF